MRLTDFKTKILKLSIFYQWLLQKGKPIPEERSTVGALLDYL